MTKTKTTAVPPDPDLSIVIVSFNTLKMTRDCLASVMAARQSVTTELFVVDNASSDGSPEMIARDFPDVRLIANRDNRGFAAANNQALRCASGRHVLLLNSDTLVKPGVLAASVRYMDQNPAVGVMGCRVLNADGSVQLTCSAFPSLGNLLRLTTGAFKLPGFGWFKRYRLDDWPRDSERDVDVVSGCYMMVRASAMRQVGLLDEDFFFFGEETDWCRRFRRAGHRVCFAPVGEIVHFGGGSSGNLNFRRDLLLTQGTVRLHLKHGGMAAAIAAFLVLFVFNSSRLAYWALAAPFTGNYRRRDHFAGVVRGYATAWPAKRSLAS